jgi:predicted CoA-binding protein
MNTKAEINEFLRSKTLAVVGVSGKRRGFGYTVYYDLKGKGYVVYPVNPNANAIDGNPCYPDVRLLPEKVDGIVLVIPPGQTEQVVAEAAAAGIKRVWMQQGAESDGAIRFCEERGISVVHGECIMMFATPAAFPHRVHRWVRGVVGKLPE